MVRCNEDDRSARLLGKRHENRGGDRRPRERRDDGERDENTTESSEGLLGKRHEDEED